MSEKIVQLNEEIIKSELKELVRGSVEGTLNELLEKEAESLTQAARYERSEARQGYRSGHYDRNLTTTSGDVTLHMPRLKGVSFETAIIERYRRRESSVEEALIEMYLAGVSVRRVEDITEALWGSKVSPATISELNKKAYIHIEDWRNRPLQGGRYPYVYVDGIYLRRNWGGEYENVAVLVAIAVNEDGFREVLGAAEGMKEDKASWVSFFQWLRGRGLDGVKLIVGDKCMGMLEAVGEVFPDAKYQRCTVHFYRNVFSIVPKSKVKIVAKMLKAIHAQESKKASREKAKAVVAELRAMKLKEAAKKVEDGIEETLTYCDFPSEHWTRIRTNNVIERLNREIRRRTRVVGTFPDGNSALMLVCARLRHVAGTQWGCKKYMNMPRTVEQIQFTPHMPKALRVAAYARVSCGKDAMLHSLAAQVDHYSTYIRHHPGWEYVGVYADEAKTGTRDSRENFQRMLADCRKGKINHIITKSISRFSRNTVTLLETVRELKGLGISVYFEEQSIDTATADGELMLSILASYAQEESLSASENQKWRVKRNFEEGIPWRFFMLGYRRENGKLAIVPEEAEIVRSIFDDYLAGKGVTAIAKRLNESGYATQRGGVFHKSAVERILRNYAYTGNLLLQTKFRENHLTKVTRKNQGELPRYHAADTHEAIISQETFDAVQAEILRRKRKYAPTKPQQPSPFTGLITCAICNKHYRRKTTATGPVWICSTYNSYGKAHCPSKAIPEEKLMQAAAQVGRMGKITAITARTNNLLEFTLADGTNAVQCWQDRSRAESWTPEMCIAAGEKTRERRQHHAES